jgi:hypothetical protein
VTTLSKPCALTVLAISAVLMKGLLAKSDHLFMSTCRGLFRHSRCFVVGPYDAAKPSSLA